MDNEIYLEHLNMLKYFWEEKKNIEAYANFEEVKLEIQKRNPEILIMWERYNQSKQSLNNIFEKL